MGLRALVLLIASSLLVVSQLGVPGLAAAEPPTLTVLAPGEDPPVCEASEDTTQAPEALVSAEPETPLVTSISPGALPICSLEKQSDHQDGSVTLFVQELAPTPYPPPSPVAGLPAVADATEQ